MPIRRDPLTPIKIADNPNSVIINPRIQFGRPCLIGTGIPTAIIAKRYRPVNRRNCALRTTGAISMRSKKRSATNRKPPVPLTYFVGSRSIRKCYVAKPGLV
jgi:hypothetical protein